MKNIIVTILLGAALLGVANAQEGKAPVKHGHGAPVPALHQGHKAHHGQRHHWGKPGMWQHRGIQKGARKPAAPVAKGSIANPKDFWGKAIQEHQAGKGKNIGKHSFRFGPKRHMGPRQHNGWVKVHGKHTLKFGPANHGNHRACKCAKKAFYKNACFRKGSHGFSCGKRGFHNAGSWGQKYHWAPRHAARFGRHSRVH